MAPVMFRARPFGAHNQVVPLLRVVGLEVICSYAYAHVHHSLKDWAAQQSRQNSAAYRQGYADALSLKTVDTLLAVHGCFHGEQPAFLCTSMLP